MRKKKKNLIKALVVAVIVGLAGFGGYEYKQNSNHTEELAAKEAELEANSQTVYVATADIAKGEKDNSRKRRDAAGIYRVGCVLLHYGGRYRINGYRGY